VYLCTLTLKHPVYIFKFISLRMTLEV